MKTNKSTSEIQALLKKN